ncbi:MAG TPA: hypothetical protein VGN69_07005 [Solirubrobacteraceae bacterium]|nr:hypothetical protein [Solirubrobacteraceae bacterium]
MLIATLICSEERCPAEFEARAATLRELEALACDCGCALAVVGWPDEDPQHPEPDVGAGVELVFLAA